MIQRVGKGAKSELLPNQRTLAKLVSPASQERLMSNYAKVTPSGENALTAPDINDMSRIKI